MLKKTTTIVQKYKKTWIWTRSMVFFTDHLVQIYWIYFLLELLPIFLDFWNTNFPSWIRIQEGKWMRIWIQSPGLEYWFCCIGIFVKAPVHFLSGYFKVYLHRRTFNLLLGYQFKMGWLPLSFTFVWVKCISKFI